MHVIFHNSADIVHIHNGGNSLWALPLRLAGKKVFVSQDGLDWKRAKWPWYGKIFLRLSSYITAYAPHGVIFDNIYAKEWFEKKFRKNFYYVPYGSEVRQPGGPTDILERLKLTPRDYFLFVGRFIPDKGLHYLISAFERVKTTKKLVLVGGTPNPSKYEFNLRRTKDQRILFPGYIYGDSVLSLMNNAYVYVQPSDIEGLSPVILTIMGLGTPLICSDIQENVFAVQNTALLFQKGNVDSLRETIEYALANPRDILDRASRAHARAKEEFSWEKAVDDHIRIFTG
jgi:glycosyltransferase involved in cell wall biosynthesis